MLGLRFVCIFPIEVNVVSNKSNSMTFLKRENTREKRENRKTKANEIKRERKSRKKSKEIKRKESKKKKKKIKKKEETNQPHHFRQSSNILNQAKIGLSGSGLRLALEILKQRSDSREIFLSGWGIKAKILPSAAWKPVIPLREPLGLWG
jgi:hypothetical protein